MRTCLLLATLVLALPGCSRDDDPPVGRPLPDPCALITPEVLDRLAPGGVRVPADDPVSRSCSIDRTGPVRGDLLVEVSADSRPGYDVVWRTARCQEIGAQPSPEGPGDAACLNVRQFDGLQARVDGWAWVGTGSQAHVAYRLVDPLSMTAEQDLRDLLAAAVAALPAG